MWVLNHEGKLINTADAQKIEIEGLSIVARFADRVETLAIGESMEIISECFHNIISCMNTGGGVAQLYIILNQDKM